MHCLHPAPSRWALSQTTVGHALGAEKAVKQLSKLLDEVFGSNRATRGVGDVVVHQVMRRVKEHPANERCPWGSDLWVAL